MTGLGNFALWAGGVFFGIVLGVFVLGGPDCPKQLKDPCEGRADGTLLYDKGEREDCFCLGGKAHRRDSTGYCYHRGSGEP
jgi:hypothetical protein